jgi:hypothetical protein
MPHLIGAAFLFAHDLSIGPPLVAEIEDRQHFTLLLCENYGQSAR